MAQAAVITNKISNFDVLKFVDGLNERIRRVTGVMHCAAEAALAADELQIHNALRLADDELTLAFEDTTALWEAEKDRLCAEQVRIDATKHEAGIGNPPPALSPEARRHLLKVLADDEVTRKSAAKLQKAKGKKR